MSTYYYLVCDDHREMTDAATASGCPLGRCEQTLRPFIVHHWNCNVRIVHEHQVTDDDDLCTYTEWTGEHVREFRNGL